MRVRERRESEREGGRWWGRIAWNVFRIAASVIFSPLFCGFYQTLMEKKTLQFGTRWWPSQLGAGQVGRVSSYGHQNGPSKRSRGLYGKPAGPRDSEGWRTVEISERPESPRVEMRAVWGPGSGTSRTSP